MKLVAEDYGGGGPVLVALHGTFGTGATFHRLAADLRGRVRVIAPDQRGHGRTGPASRYTLADFTADAAEFVDGLDLGPVVVLGHSLGGLIAFHLAARHPALVRALIVEDAAAINSATLDVTDWPTSAPTREALAAALVERGIPDPAYFMQSAVPTDAGGWRFLFSWSDMTTVQREALGDWWPDWLAGTRPTLLLRGARSPLLSAAEADEMVTRRPDTVLTTFAESGHWIHDDEPAAFAERVAAFVDGLGRR
ncbi:alpha/beta fold hydrolase [Actinokineospora terrae]|uniref:Pimeloyl-ACP methyl ester carboxylesterase n=1 Tax=Actinokineospora terrae TaxID=155974 RepID=A0A1H9KNC0_9PSEU|nr:alpha/beta hydrolase [Actinokineospora terrae]SER00592.1 Pimeloyl-ACP methyl ester carboxylesterase [Actinokineospora terrae]